MSVVVKCVQRLPWHLELSSGLVGLYRIVCIGDREIEGYLWGLQRATMVILFCFLVENG